MEYAIILGIGIVAMITLKIAFRVKLQDVKKIKQIGEDKGLNDITNAFPENRVVCEKILEQLGNQNVKIKESEDSSSKLTYYSVVTNDIVIANIKDTFTRIQTIAHECLHSVQNRKMLLFNFIFSNLYLLYFGLIVILTLCRIIKNPILAIIIFIVLGFIYYAVRSYLEIDAMTKAPYVAKEYMEKSNKITKDKIQIIMKQYEVINQIGIPMMNFYIFMSVFIKVIIYIGIAMMFK